MRDLHLPGRSPVLATNGMAATSHPLASLTAVEMLKAGGNAVDAAIAAAFVLCICEPQMTGLGGDCFALVRPAGGGNIVALNGSGRSPAGYSAQALRARGLTRVPTEGADAVTLPGMVDALCRLAADWGRIPLADCLAPAIRYAEEGVPVAPRVAFDWASDGHRLTGAARRFYLRDGAPPAAGQIFRAPGQAEVMRRIAREGRAGFYDGEVARDLIGTLQALGGTHTPDDLAATACAYAEPVTGRFAGHELAEHPPNGQGATAILMLNILSRFDLAALDPRGADRAHLEAEAAKLAYEARDRFIADPDRTARLGHMLAPETADRLAGLIDMKRAAPAPDPRPEAVHRDTVYLTVADRDRMAVSLICSIYWGFGAGIASDRFGILYQNRAAGFTLTPGHPNEAGPARRPMHTIIPAMLRGPGMTLPFGVMGGAFQPAGHARLVTNHLTYGMDLQAAIDAPRSFPRPEGLAVERGYDQAVRDDLAARGHRVFVPDEPLGGAQAILIDEGRGLLTAGSDPRKDGCALGW